MNNIKFLLILITITGCYYTPCTHDHKKTNNIKGLGDLIEQMHLHETINKNGTEEYHGKEGKSEYGEYEPNKCLKWKEDAYDKWMESQ